MKRFRRAIAHRVWDLASWLYPYATPTYEAETEQGWEISYYFEATEKDANEFWDRLSDAVCNSDHHALDPCPASPFVGGMHPVTLDEEGNPT